MRHKRTRRPPAVNRRSGETIGRINQSIHRASQLVGISGQLASLLSAREPESRLHDDALRLYLLAFDIYVRLLDEVEAAS